jgi:tRNA(Ile)-lysidine synthase
MARDADPAPDPGRLLADLNLEHRSALVAAVSGGGDSLALLDLARTALATRHPHIRLTAVTVDHGLRPEAAEEARYVGDICGKLGVPHRTVKWRDPKKEKGGLIARARAARHALLAQAAEEAGTDIVLLGHTRDDQAETLAMRRARSDASNGWKRGDAGMARATLFDGRVWFVRPLLGLSRATLRDHLRQADLAWIDDPTNVDMRYERPRIRAQMTAESDPERIMAGLAEEAEKAGRQRAEAGRLAAMLLDRHASQPAPGLFRLDPALCAEKDHDAALYAFRSLLGVAGGAEQLPDHARAADLFENLDRIGFCATLSRTVVESHASGIFLHRESRNLGRCPLVEGTIWDGRFRVSALPRQTGLELGPCGREMAVELANPLPGVPERLVRAALSAEPAICAGKRFLKPASDEETLVLERLAAPFARYLGDFDIALARAMARLLGTLPPPASPWADHNGG